MFSPACTADPPWCGGAAHPPPPPAAGGAAAPPPRSPIRCSMEGLSQPDSPQHPPWGPPPAAAAWGAAAAAAPPRPRRGCHRWLVAATSQRWQPLFFPWLPLFFSWLPPQGHGAPWPCGRLLICRCRWASCRPSSRLHAGRCHKQVIGNMESRGAGMRAAVSDSRDRRGTEAVRNRRRQ